VTLVLQVAAGYLLGRAMASLAHTVVKVVVRRLVERSPHWRALVRRDVARDRRLWGDLDPATKRP
jgi:hypothetical protein